MPSRKSYNRFFIILQEDQKGYGVDANKTPSGYAKLETRNDRAKMSFYIQDVKKQNGPYYMVLIAQGNGGTRELINLGQINIDESGKADVSNEHDANNIANTNISMEKIQGAGICRINGSKVNPVMVGFICGEEIKNWSTYPMAKAGSKGNKSIENIVKSSNKVEEKEVKKEVKKESSNEELKKIEAKKEEKKTEPVENKRALNEKSSENDIEKEVKEVKEEVQEVSTVEEVQNFDEYEEQIERLKEYRKKQHCKECDEEKDYHHHNKDNDKDEKNKCKSNYQEHHEDYPIGPMGEFFKGVVLGLEKMGPMGNIDKCMWYKAKVESLDDMYCIHDYNKYSVIFYPMICYYPYIAKSKNFMVGYKCDEQGTLKYIIYAIPGTKDLIDQPYEGKTGFVTFMEEVENSHRGHWLMYYDVKKNTVVVPVKKSK